MGVTLWKTVIANAQRNNYFKDTSFTGTSCVSLPDDSLPVCLCKPAHRAAVFHMEVRIPSSVRPVTAAQSMGTLPHRSDRAHSVTVRGSVLPHALCTQPAFACLEHGPGTYTFPHLPNYFLRTNS